MQCETEWKLLFAGVLFISSALVHENDGYDIQPCMIGIRSVAALHTNSHTDHICMSLSCICSLLLSWGFVCVCAAVTDKHTDEEEEEEAGGGLALPWECVHLSANSDQDVTYVPDSFFLIFWGVSVEWFSTLLSHAFYRPCHRINSRLLIHFTWEGWGGLRLCLFISPLPHNSQQNNKWKHRAGPLSYQLIMGLM